MLSSSQYISDKHILSSFAANNPIRWELLYNKYAPVMYSIIHQLTNNKTLVEEIFTSAFLELKQNKKILYLQDGICSPLLKYTYSFAIQRLKKYGEDPTYKNLSPDISLTQLLYTRCKSLKEAATILNISEKEAKNKLYLEFLNLRNSKFEKKNSTN